MTVFFIFLGLMAGFYALLLLLLLYKLGRAHVLRYEHFRSPELRPVLIS